MSFLTALPLVEAVYVGGEDAVDRVRVGGSRTESHGGVVVVYPRVSRLDYEALMVADLPEEEGLFAELLSSVSAKPRVDLVDFVAARKVVRQDLDSGRSRLLVVPNVPRAEIDEDLGDAVTGKVEIEEEFREKQYSLQQFFTDSYLWSRYSLDMKTVETVKRMAPADAESAARFLQSAVNERNVGAKVRVNAGYYARSRAASKKTLRRVADPYPLTSVAIFSLVIDRKLYMYGPEGEDDWHVMGPISAANEIADVHRMVSSVGPVTPSVLLGMEMVLLEINVFDGSDYVAPEVEGHVGELELDVASYRSAQSEVFTVAQSIEVAEMVDRILPVMSGTGQQVASSVRVTGKHVLMSTHVRDQHPDCTVVGESLNMSIPISRDLWACKLEGDARSWVYRDPVVGEQAVICYRHGDEVSVSPPVKIVSIDGTSLLLTKTTGVVPGMSGGAVVAVRDLALLGVHNGATMRNLICSQFSQSQFSDLMDYDNVSTVSRELASAEVGNSMYMRLKNRGLGSVVEAAVRSISAVYVGPAHVGMAVSTSSGIVTACDANDHLLVSPARVPGVYDKVEGTGMFKSDLNLPGTTTPVLTRRPGIGERVFVVGADTDGIYFSNPSSVVHVSPNARSFVIRDLPDSVLPTRGGLVMAVSDAATLGVCGPLEATIGLGPGVLCWPLPKSGQSVNVVSRAVETLTRTFPMLNVTLWPPGLVEEVITHSSVTTYTTGKPFNVGCKPLANIGDSAVKVLLFAELREAFVPHGTWASVVAAKHTNAKFADTAWRLGITSLIHTAPGVDLQRGSKGHADMLEALIGAVYLHETSDTFHTFCQALGATYTASVDGSSPMLRNSSDDFSC